MSQPKRLRMFAGPNGSGKSTIKDVISTSHLGHYLNPDDIERQLKQNPIFALNAYKPLVINPTTISSFFATTTGTDIALKTEYVPACFVHYVLDKTS